MLLYTILSIVALVAEVALLAYFICKTAKYKKPFSKNTLWYAVPVFILVYYLFTIGYVYAGKTVTALSVLRMLFTTLEAFTFKIELNYFTELALANGWYYAATIIATLFAGATLIASVIGLWGSKIKNKIKLWKALSENRELILGDSPSSLSYAKTNGAIIVTFDGQEKAEALIGKGYLVISAELDKENKKLQKQLAKHSRQDDKESIRQFIAFADNEFAYAKIINWFLTAFKSAKVGFYTLHIEASLTEMDIINRKFIDSKKPGDSEKKDASSDYDRLCIKSFNKYELMARKFIMDYPLSAYVPDDFYGEYRTIKHDKKINVVCIGFGKVNYELMKLSVMQNQFVETKTTKDENGNDITIFANHPVNYYIYDTEEKRLYSEMVMRMKNGFKTFVSHDLPAPEIPCNIATPKNLNIYSEEFVDELNNIITDKDSFTYLLVSVGTDYENMAYAEHLNDAYADSKLKIFTRIQHTQTLKDKDSSIVTFGYEKDLLSRDILINEKLEVLAMKINGSYNNKDGQKKSNAELIKDYNSRHTIEMYSNIYHAASIFFKIGLLGLRFVDKSDESYGKALTKQELFDRFSGYTANKNDYDRYLQLNAWCMLGFSEHSRWNAQYLLKGFRQMPMDEMEYYTDAKGIPNVKGKDIAARKHCCLTTYYALDKYHQKRLEMIRSHNHPEAKIADDNVQTYRYDYMFVNDCYDNMIKNGYKLVEIR